MEVSLTVHGGLSTTSRIQDYNVSKNEIQFINLVSMGNTVDYWNISSTVARGITRTVSGMKLDCHQQ